MFPVTPEPYFNIRRKKRPLVSGIIIFNDICDLSNILHWNSNGRSHFPQFICREKYITLTQNQNLHQVTKPVRDFVI